MTVILLRHGRSTSNTAHTLAGRSEGVELDEKGLEQAAALVERLAGVPIKALVRSPLLRCRMLLACKRAPMTESKVVLPAPDGPIKAMCSPACASRQMPLSAA